MGRLERRAGGRERAEWRTTLWVSEASVRER